VSLFEWILFFSLLIMALLALDDYVIDLLALWFKAKPQKLSDSFQSMMDYLEQKPIAIMVANWKEAEVIEAMVLGNLEHIDYQNYHFFLGVYPNDFETVEAVRRLTQLHPRIHAVVNHKPGPTSKGQMLNVIAQSIFDLEEALGIRFEIFMMHDSEDVIHPLSLKLINTLIRQVDFVQTPVFSFDRAPSELVGSTYADEFSDHHTHEMLVRTQLRVAVPSAGTGTALSRSAMLKLLNHQNGQFLKEGSLTEDYLLGQTIHQLGLSSQFACFYKESTTKRKKDFIATREYFPNTFRASVKQKTRWNVGIICQGWEYFGWQGSWLDKYFLWRDRRGLFNSLIVILSFVFLCYFAFRKLFDISALNVESSSIFQFLVVFNFIAFFWRISHRIKALHQVHHSSMLWLVPIRWILANVINTSATIRALKQYLQSRLSEKAIVWSKTDHELPAMLISKATDMAQKIANQNASQLVLSKTQPIAVARSSEITVPLMAGSVTPSFTNLGTRDFIDLDTSGFSNDKDLISTQNTNLEVTKTKLKEGSTNELASS